MENAKESHPLQDYYSRIYRTYDRVNRIFTFGRDRSWRSKAVAACLEIDPGSVLDICTGTGDLILEIGKKVGNEVRLEGYDFSAEMLTLAREKSNDKPFEIIYTEGDVANMPYQDNSFDAATISFGLRNLVFENSNADKHLSEINRVIRKDGRFIILESSKPVNPVWRVVNNIYLQLILPYLGGLISGNLSAYKYLANSSKNYYTPGQLAYILEQGGFRVIRSKPLFLGSVLLVVAEKQDNSNAKKSD